MADCINTSVDDLTSKISRLLEEEIDDYVQTSKHQNMLIHRNGFYKRNFYTLNGLLQLQIPRLRKAKFESKIIQKFKRTTQDFESMIAFLLQSFMSYEMIIDFVEQMTGIRIGHSIISKIANNLYERYRNIYEGEIDKTYDYVFIDACYYKVMKYIHKETGQILDALPANFKMSDYFKRSYDICILIAIGIDDEGYKSLLGIDTYQTESALA